MRGGATAFGAVSLVNAVAGGKGATVSVALTTEAAIEIDKGEGAWETTTNGRDSVSPLAVESVRRALVAMGRRPNGYRGRISTVSSVPIGVGLKTSSSSSVAIAMAVMDALGEKRPGNAEVLECSVKASLKSGASVTGALDDAASCLLGGVNLADNSRGKLVSSSRLPRALDVLVRIPTGKSRRSLLDLRQARRLGLVADSLFSICKSGAYWTAMTLNGILYSNLLGYDTEPAVQAVDLGALGAGLSGTGPSVAAVFDADGGDAMKRVARHWSRAGATVLRTVTNNRRAKLHG